MAYGGVAVVSTISFNVRRYFSGDLFDMYGQVSEVSHEVSDLNVSTIGNIYSFSYPLRSFSKKTIIAIDGRGFNPDMNSMYSPESIYRGIVGTDKSAFLCIARSRSRYSPW